MNLDYDLADYDAFVSGIEDQLDRNEQHRLDEHYDAAEDDDDSDPTP